MISVGVLTVMPALTVVVNLVALMNLDEPVHHEGSPSRRGWYHTGCAELVNLVNLSCSFAAHVRVRAHARRSKSGVAYRFTKFTTRRNELSMWNLGVVNVVSTTVHQAEQ